MKLLIVLPALNEEHSIAAMIEASLAARSHIVAGGVVGEVQVTVVSDGSTDKTAEIARRYEDHISLIVFPQNRGYGAAIKEAWRRSDAELLGFLDADGTCDPRIFRELCAAVADQDADVVLGSRLGAASKMLRVRRFGNQLFAWLLSAVAMKTVRDTASGMRVVRRDRVLDLMPLPDGMHFTPAMSARALLAGDIKLVEVPMPYAERTGLSKLRAFRDGLRFLGSILDATFLYRPARLLEPSGLIAVASAIALMARPIAHYLIHRNVEDWMIYRFLVSQLAATLGLMLLGASHLASRTANLLLRRQPQPSFVGRLVARLIDGRESWVLSLALVALGVALVWPGLRQLVSTGSIWEHWSRFVAMAFFLQCAGLLLVSKGIGYALDLLATETAADRSIWWTPSRDDVAADKEP